MSVQEFIELLQRVASCGFTLTATSDCFVIADGLATTEVDAADLPEQLIALLVECR